jgi:DNA-binding NarL/FixJ family response regulator
VIWGAAAAIAAATAGFVAATPELLEHALRHGASPSPEDVQTKLTVREIEVLAKLASGWDNRTIAEVVRQSGCA